ncbi:MFS general substrate transporter [Fomitiporia mediterranea MF3/22]|uniref:MFS general substrate transporter n=1 Tax=Fomitiporia mediterranea (strain MF3/22) TaxID=694068 RepID=UPI000440830B|nr:MFS general substrate transporter [Fomitiporia mediterranea MF3/22]EJC98223.1 MFS general substrate transporter [Fomitiporia mediterranea MF3/22]
MSTIQREGSSEHDGSIKKQDIEIEETRVACQDNTSNSDEEKSLVISVQERKLVRKLDKRILPIICLMYLFAFLDRSNLGNARLQGLPEDTLHGDPTGKLYNWVFSAFFFSYILCQVPLVITSKFFPPRRWLGLAVIGWGICSTLMATGFNFTGLFIDRVMLGAFEAASGPIIPLYLSYFYTKHEIGLRLAYYQTFSAIAGVCGGFIAFGIQNANIAIANWRLLFIVEGVPGMLMGVIALFALPDRPEMTHFFTEDERRLAMERRTRSISGDVGFTVNKSHIRAGFKDWRVYIGGVVFFGINCSFASISAFLPTIIKTFGFTNALAQLLTVPPYAVAAIVMILTSYTSDRIQNRGLLMSVANAVCAIGYLILLVERTNQHVRYFAVFCITSGVFAAIGLIIAWYAHNLGSETKRATGIPLFMAIGQCGSILGSQIFPSTEGPLYIRGFAVTCGLEFLAAICSFVLSISYFLDNRRRDRLYGKPKPDAKVDTSELADKAPMFRYVP